MLLKESDLCKRIQKEELLKKIEGEPKNFFLLLDWSLLNEQPLGWRATWLLRHVSQKGDERLQAYIDQIISKYPTFNESQKREWLKNLIEQPLTDKQQGVLFDQCISDWRKISHRPALRSSAMQVIFKILRKYPELMREIDQLLEIEYLDELSPGIKKGILKEWNQIKSDRK